MQIQQLGLGVGRWVDQETGREIKAVLSGAEYYVTAQNIPRMAQHHARIEKFLRSIPFCSFDELAGFAKL